MPLTIAHAAVAPALWRLTRRRLVLSALVVGTMSPDFEYLLRLSAHRTISHTLLGLVVFCVPASLVALALWHRLVGPAFAPHLPGGIADAAARPFAFGPPARFLRIALSAAVGACTHLAWDAFTHGSGPVVTRLAVLSDPLWAGGPDGYIVAWWASTLAGTALVGGWLVRLAGAPASPRQEAASSMTRLSRRRLWALVIVSGVTVAAANAAHHSANGASSQQVLVGSVLGAIMGTTVATVATGTVLRARSRRPSGIRTCGSPDGPAPS